MASPHRTRNADQRIVEDADQVEWEAIAKGRSPIDAGIRDEKIARALDDFDPDDPSKLRWENDDIALDSAVGRTHEELERRANILDKAYPFEIKGNTLIYRKSRSGVYEFCLAICKAKDLTKGANVQLPRTFERVSCDLVTTHFGSNARGFYTGWPRDKEISAFSQAMKALHDACGEWNWRPTEDLDPDREKGDEGVDFIIWKGCGDDERLARFFILGQCACGNDWPQKFEDININALKDWFHPMTYVEPTKSFSIPRILSKGFLFEASRKAGLVFDRIRLTLIAERELNKHQIDTLQPALNEIYTPYFSLSQDAP